jgi:hypothetical protein
MKEMSSYGDKYLPGSEEVRHLHNKRYLAFIKLQTVARELE